MTFEIEPPDEPCPDCGSAHHRACGHNSPSPAPAEPRKCVGFAGGCDGNLPGEPHEENCPAGHAETPSTERELRQEFARDLAGFLRRRVSFSNNTLEPQEWEEIASVVMEKWAEAEKALREGKADE